MRSGNQFQVVRMVELLADVLAEGVAGTSGWDTPSTSVVRVRPEEVADWAFMWHLHDSVELLDLVKGVDAWGKSSVETKDVSFDDSGEGQVIEEGSEVLPDIGISVLSKALVVESIHLGDLFWFVVASENSDSVWVSDFESHE